MRKVLMTLPLVLLACEGTHEGTEVLIEHPEIDGICGVNFAKCQDPEATKEKFRKLKKTSWSSDCTKSPDGTGGQTITVSVKVPRLLADHDGSKDTLTLRTNLYGSVDETVNVLMEAQRNGVTTGWWFQDAAGNVAESEPLLDFYETGMALFADKRNYQRFQDAADSCELSSPIIWQYAINGLCVSCKIHKVAIIGLGSALVAAAAGVTAGAGAAAAAGIVTGTIDEFFSCDRFCEIGKCGVNFDTCIATALMRGPGPTRDRMVEECKKTVSDCCKTAEGTCAGCTAREHGGAVGVYCCCTTRRS